MTDCKKTNKNVIRIILFLLFTVNVNVYSEEIEVSREESRTEVSVYGQLKANPPIEPEISENQEVIIKSPKVVKENDLLPKTGENTFYLVQLKVGIVSLVTFIISILYKQKKSRE